MKKTLTFTKKKKPTLVFTKKPKKEIILKKKPGLPPKTKGSRYV